VVNILGDATIEAFTFKAAQGPGHRCSTPRTGRPLPNGLRLIVRRNVFVQTTGRPLSVYYADPGEGKVLRFVDNLLHENSGGFGGAIDVFVDSAGRPSN
jgi:hypothetical protein